MASALKSCLSPRTNPRGGSWDPGNSHCHGTGILLTGSFQSWETHLVTYLAIFPGDQSPEPHGSDVVITVVLFKCYSACSDSSAFSRQLTLYFA